MDFLASFLGRAGYLPHGYCFTWTPGLLWTMVGADGVIAAAYFSIPVAMITFVRKRADSSWSGMAWLFSAFIFACGVTHLMDIWTIWQPDYGPQAVSKVITAAISMVTAIALWPLIPRALKIPSVGQLQAVIASLEAEVTKRRTAEDSLVEIQQSLAVTLASIGAGFIATDREGRVTRMNAVAEAVTGWPEAEARGQRLWTVFDREERPPAYLEKNPVDLVTELGVTEQTVSHVIAVSRSGARTALDVNAALTHASDGTVRGLAVVFRDQTRLLTAEVEASRLAAIVESSNDAILGKSLDGRIISWNRGAQALFGHSAEEAIGQPVEMLIPPDRKLEEMRILADLAHGASVPPFETVRRAKDGSLLDVSVTISPIRDSRGRVVGGSSIARDVTRQRRAEAALRDSEARLRFTLESAQIGDWVLDLATGAARRSLRHDRCFGYVELQPEWSFDRFIAHIHPDDRAEVLRSFHQAVNDRRDWLIQCRVVWPDASLHWISAHGSIQHEGGQATRMLGIITDITEQRLAEEARLKAQRLEAENRQIQEASRLKSQFLANMSHELRTPLNAIIGFAELLHSGAVPSASPKHREYLGHIGTSGRHLLQLINDVLDLSKVESGRFEFFPERVALPLLFKEVGDILHTSIVRKALQVVIDIEPGLDELVLDPARLKQVLYNYLSNAIKFTPEGGRVTLRARAEGLAHWRLEVEDTGIGIAPTDMARLFVEFQQLDAGYGKQHQGTGLGLALTRRLVQAQGGSVGLRSTVGVGSVFHAVLKRVHGDDVPLPEAQPGPAGGVTERRLLVIEASRSGSNPLADALGEAGFELDVASTGDEALSRAQGRPYGAIALDLVMPGQQGLVLLARIRTQGPNRHSPVVGVSMPVNEQNAARFPIADVLAKPLRSEDVVAAMARLGLPSARRARVLVIDDDPLALELMRSALQALHVDVVGVLDGRQALRDMEQHRPDAIVLDLMMPEFDGFATLDALARLPAWRSTPVFIWTSMLLTDEEHASLARSAREILSKGGGALEALLVHLRGWRPPVALPDSDLVP